MIPYTMCTIMGPHRRTNGRGWRPGPRRAPVRGPVRGGFSGGRVGENRMVAGVGGGLFVLIDIIRCLRISNSYEFLPFERREAITFSQ